MPDNCEMKEGDLPCDLCNIIQNLSDIVAETSKQIKELEPVKTFNQMQVKLRELRNSHKTCAGCHMCFGGKHIAKEFKYYDDLGLVCQWCANDIKRQGLDVFKKRLKIQSKEELSEDAG